MNIGGGGCSCDDDDDEETRRRIRREYKMSRLWKPSEEELCVHEVQDLLQEERVSMPNAHQEHLDSCL